jgi:hypothetical protein
MHLIRATRNLALFQGAIPPLRSAPGGNDNVREGSRQSGYCGVVAAC